MISNLKKAPAKACFHLMPPPPPPKSTSVGVTLIIAPAMHQLVEAGSLSLVAGKGNATTTGLPRLRMMWCVAEMEYSSVFEGPTALDRSFVPPCSSKISAP